MDVVGLCSVCGKPAKNSCKMCGRIFCDDHFDKKLGICNSCKRGRTLSTK